jgi:phenylpropionate dioxygenase-like ring-hydroxylating dioxygenase large terminal subunit
LTVTIFKSYQDVIQNDDDTAETFYDVAPRNYPSDPVEVPVAVYIDRRYHEREKENIWTRTWQVACREEHVPEPGDQYVYDIADKSYLIVRGIDRTIRAFVNVCLHRGRMLRDYDVRAPEIRCPFHGAIWNLDGSFRTIPCRNEFASFSDENWKLPEVSVGLWAGFVFINPDPNPEPLADYLGDLVPQFDRWAIERRYVSLHVIKKQRCNWKIAQEAFMEAYHVSVTHPQSAWGYGDIISQYDAFENYSRAISPRAVHGVQIKAKLSEEEIIEKIRLAGRGDNKGGKVLTENQTAREYMKEFNRGTMEKTLGVDTSKWSTAELVDHLYFTVFPNFHPWGSTAQFMYRFRPNGDDHQTSLMELIFLPTYTGERPPPAKPIVVDFDDSWVPSAGPVVGVILDQDSLNLPRVQQGLAATRQKTVRFATSQENKIRHFYRVYARRLGEDWGQRNLAAH